MNYRSRQVRLMWKQEQEQWALERYNLQQDILNLQNSTDAKVIEQLEESLAQEKNQSQSLEKDLTKAQQSRTRRKTRLDLAQTKITSLEQKIQDQDTALINLAKQKIANKKEAKALVEQLEIQWKTKQTEWQQANQQQQDLFAQQLAQTKAEQAEEVKSLKQQAQEDKVQAVGLAMAEGEKKLQEAKSVFDYYKAEKDQELQEQKSFYETKIRGLEKEIDKLTELELFD